MAHCCRRVFSAEAPARTDPTAITESPKNKCGKPGIAHADAQPEQPMARGYGQDSKNYLKETEKPSISQWLRYRQLSKCVSGGRGALNLRKTG